MHVLPSLIETVKLMQAPFWLTYDFPPAVREKLKQQWGQDWKGQAQKWSVVIIHPIK